MICNFAYTVWQIDALPFISDIDVWTQVSFELELKYLNVYLLIKSLIFS